MQRLEQIKAFLAENDQDPFLHFALAKEYEKLGQQEEALSCYLKLRDRFTDYVGTYYHLGKLYESLSKFEEAMHAYEAGIEIARQAGDQHSLSELQGAKMNLDIL